MRRIAGSVAEDRFLPNFAGGKRVHGNLHNVTGNPLASGRTADEVIPAGGADAASPRQRRASARPDRRTRLLVSLITLLSCAVARLTAQTLLVTLRDDRIPVVRPVGTE
jgi:hypothetical protein